MCNDIIPEGTQVCRICEQSPNEKRIGFLELKVAIWQIIVKENLIVTNQNLDWLLERAFKEI
jgi:hypothetical protein